MSSALDFEEKKTDESALPEEQQRPLTQETLASESPPSEAATPEAQLPPPPDGGLHAWLKVVSRQCESLMYGFRTDLAQFGGFLIYINIWYVL
jgi:hypothetical protein